MLADAFRRLKLAERRISIQPSIRLSQIAFQLVSNLIFLASLIFELFTEESLVGQNLAVITNAIAFAMLIITLIMVANLQLLYQESDSIVYGTERDETTVMENETEYGTL